MRLTLSGKNVVVTGASGGIGSALCRALRDEGAQLAITSASDERLSALRDDLGHAVAHASALNITDEPAVSAFFEQAGTALGGVDALVNLAGLSVPGPVAEMPVAEFGRVMDVNVIGTFLACKHVIPRAADGAVIVNVGSMAAHRPNANAPAYCAAKAAVAMFTDAFGMQVADRNIRVTTISPGGVDTPFWGDRDVNRAAMLTAADVVEAIVYVLTRPPHVIVRDLVFESTGRTR